MRHRFKSLVSRRFRRSYLKANEVSKSEGRRKLEHRVHIIFKSMMMLFTKNYQNKSMLVETTTFQSWLFF